ncbi:hypothetical protein Tco_0187658, partial [Tanacetum coccineum]
GELIYSRVPIADPHLLRDTHTVDGVFVRDEDQALYFESSPEFGGASGSRGCGDDKSGDDKDGDEDKEDGDS